MMKKGFALFFVLLACTVLNSCSLEDDTPNFYFTTLQVVAADFPETFAIDNMYDIEVTYIRPDGCTFFEGFDVTKNGDTDRDVTVIGTVLTNDEAVCTQAIEEVNAIFRFNVIFSGEYHFRFYNGRDENDNPIYLEYTVPVE